jgi:hypothetical protein
MTQVQTHLGNAKNSLKDQISQRIAKLRPHSENARKLLTDKIAEAINYNESTSRYVKQDWRLHFRELLMLSKSTKKRLSRIRRRAIPVKP